MPRVHPAPPRRFVARVAAATLAAVALIGTESAAQGAPPSTVTFTGGRGNISNTVAIPANAAVVWTSGTVPGVTNPDAPANSRARYGDTKTQAISVLTSIEARLKEHGLTMKDVVYLRAYLVPDPDKGNAIDSQGWNAAYDQFFNNANNPTKPARSTVGVTALVNAAWLVEVEAFAVYPATP